MNQILIVCREEVIITSVAAPAEEPAIKVTRRSVKPPDGNPIMEKEQEVGHQSLTGKELTRMQTGIKVREEKGSKIENDFRKLLQGSFFVYTQGKESN